MIPKVINYCWFGGKDLPKEVKQCIKTWKNFCPDYKIICWNEKNFNVHLNPFVESAYENGAWAFVSDYARLKIIYDYGGIYLDTDVKLLKNIDFLLSNKMYVGIQQGEKLCNTGLGFGAEAHHPVVGKMLKAYDSIVYSDEIADKISCPRLNNQVLQKIGYKYSNEIQNIKNVTVYPPEYMDPIAQGDSQDLLSDNSFSISLYLGSWTSKGNQLKRKLFVFIGLKRIEKIKHFLKKKR